MYKCRIFLIVRYIFLVSVSVAILTSCSDFDDLSPKQARKALKGMTGFELPDKAENIRGIYPFMRDPHLFIKFETDSEGIAEVMTAFGGPDAKITQLNEEDFERRKKLGLELFYSPSKWQDAMGIKLFNDESFKVGRLLERPDEISSGQAGYNVFINDLDNTVYIYAWEP